jgi:signal transduction histidine kinase
MTDYQDHHKPPSGDFESRHNNTSEIHSLSDALLEILPIGVVTFDGDLRIIEANKSARKIIDLQKFADKSLACVNDPDNNSINWAKLLNKIITSGDTQVFDNLRYVNDSGIKIFKITCTALPQAEAAPKAALIIEDCTENTNIQKRLTEAEKLAAVGKLASKVAHELNNPMDGILRYLNLTMRLVEAEQLTKPKEYLTRCHEGLMRMVRIVSELLEFARTNYGAFEYVKIEEIIEDAVRMMSVRAEGCGVKIARKYTAAIGEVKSGSLFQVFCNLISNAIEAMPESGTLTISTGLVDEGTAVVEFHDTGTGFDPKDTDAIFQPFFSSKGKGTGLGLAICKEIIERYPGRITAEANPEGGSIFKVVLPLTTKDFSTT